MNLQIGYNLYMNKKLKAPVSVLKTELKSYISNKNEDIAHVFSKLEQPSNLQYFDGIYSIDTSMFIDGMRFFAFNDKNIKRGFVSSDNLKTLSLIDGKNKILTSVTSSVYHFLCEDVHHILLAATGEYKELEIIINISNIRDKIADLTKMNLFNVFFKTLTDKGVKFRLVDFDEFDVINVDNFFVMQAGFSSLDRFNMLHDYFSIHLDYPDENPFRKVYVSRRKVGSPNKTVYRDEFGNFNDISLDRVDDEEQLENIFKSFGFEIVYPEDFSDFIEQLNFFNSVKTIASLTSAGLSNMSFMQPGGNVVEIITPLTARPLNGAGEPGFMNREFHNYYKNMAVTKNHFYVGIPNLYCKVEDIKTFIKSNKNLEQLLKDI